jgi:hypothetical protein
MFLRFQLVKKWPSVKQAVPHFGRDVDRMSQATMRQRNVTTKPMESLSKPTNIATQLSRVDVYPKVSSEFKVNTSTGGTGI